MQSSDSLDAAQTDSQTAAGFAATVVWVKRVTPRFVAQPRSTVSHQNQRDFFSTHLQPWVAQMYESVGAHPKALFYASLAAFGAAFAGVETQGFDMLEA